jgi:hypothetical protein
LRDEYCHSIRLFLHAALGDAAAFIAITFCSRHQLQAQWTVALLYPVMIG